MDSNKDGYIDATELDAALKLYGLHIIIYSFWCWLTHFQSHRYGLLPFSYSNPSTTALFQRTDKNKDGLIDLGEFRDVVKQDVEKQGNPYSEMNGRY